MVWTRGITAGLAVVAACCVASPARASLRPTDSDLALSSAAAVRGRVAALRVVHDPVVDAIYTLVAIDVDRAWGLDETPRRVVVKQLGGVLGDTALVVGGQARFAPGEDVLVFLEVRPRDRTFSVAGFEHGKWTAVATAPDAAPSAARDLTGLDARGGATRETRPITQIEALAALAGTRVRAGDVDLLADTAVEAGHGAVAAPAFALLSPGTPARWHQADDGVPVYVDAQAGGDPHVAGGGIAETLTALAGWNRVSALQLRPGAFRAARCFAHGEALDERISISYHDPCGEIADTSLTLAIGGAYFSSADTRTVNGVRFWKITAGMIVLDDAPGKIAALGRGCYTDLIAHEIGHAIGLGHAASRPALMYPTLAPECATREAGQLPQSDDEAGAALLYPRSQRPAPGIPNGLGAAVAGDTVRMFWDRPTWGPPPTAYQLEVGSAPGVADRAVAILGGTEFVAARVPNGTYHVRVRALAGGAAGVATPDIVVSVGVPAPGSPRQVTAWVTPERSAGVAWQPPASGTATRYLVQIGVAPGRPQWQVETTATLVGAPHAPRGTYYVRVVAVNGTVAGAPSDEVTLVVPD